VKSNIKAVLLPSFMILAMCPVLYSGSDDMQASSDLKITSPQNGVVVSPGQTLNVVVEVASGKSFTNVGIIGENMGIGMEGMKSAPPYEWQITIPNGQLGRKNLTAVGAISPGNAVFSEPVAIDIEGTAGNGPSAIKVEPRMLHFQYAGQQMPLQAYQSSNGNWTDIRDSSQISFTSSNEKVAVVGPQGMVTGTGSGTANIAVSYVGQTATIPVSIPQVPRGVLKGYGQPENDDLNIIFSGMGLIIPDLTAACPSVDPKTNNYADCVSKLPKDRSMPAVKPVDWRDLNGDGLIDYRDAEELVRLCAHPHCGYR
jgi:hypothetical protein